MNQQDLLRTVQLQQAEINGLKEQLSNYQGNNYEIKYKKALKEISGIIKANRQLKDELIRLSQYKSSQNESFNQINKEEIGKAYEKVLKDKSLILGEKEILELENEKMRYTIASLEETVAKLKSDKMALARESEGVSKLNLLERSSDENSKEKLRDRESEYRRTLENYEERDANLVRNNRKLEEQILDMENQLFKVEENYKTKLNEKDIELRVSKSSAREEFQSQISQMKKEITELKLTNSELNMRLESYAEEQRNFGEGRNEYEEQLIETLRELRSQIEPMSIQIHELQNQNEFEKEENQREKANLLIKVMEDEREIERLRETYKILEIKLLKEIEKCRKFEESETMIRRLEEENRMLGGKVIVLESKEVALRNRSGDELEERVVEFQTRVEMLLNEKEEISSIKTVPIQQLIALKAYVFELDSKLKQLVKENEYAVSKYKSYKEKTTSLVRELKQHDIAINGLKSKLQGYDRLVIKLQGELERAININDNEFKMVNMKINESSMVGETNVDAYKKRYESLVEKLSLQEKYSEQEIQTLRLNYDTKLIDLNIKLGELDSVKETIGLYKIKNEELSHKLTQKENELLETKISSGARTTITTVSNSVGFGGTGGSGFNFQVANLEIELTDVKQRYEMEVNKVKKLKESSEEERSKIDSLELSLSKVKSELREMEQRHKVELLEIETRPISKPVNLDFDLRSLQMEYNELQIRYERIEKDSQRYANLTREYENEISILNQNIANINKSLERERENNGKTIENENERQSQIEQLQYQYRLLTSKFNDIQEAINEKEQEIAKNRIEFNKDKYILQTELQNKEEDINRLNREITKIKNELTYKYEQDNEEKDITIATLTKDLTSLRNEHAILTERQVEWEYEVNNKHNEQNKIINEFNFVRNRVDELEHELELVRAELNRVRFQASNAETSLSSQFEEIQSKESAILRCQNDLRIKNQEISELEQELQEKKVQINRISYELNETKGKYSELEEDRNRKDGDWNSLNRQLMEIRTNLEGYEYESNMKDAALERSKNEIKELKREVDGLHEEIFEKNKELTSVNQQLFRVRLDNEETENDNVHRLQNEIYSLKSRITSLQSELSEKEDEITRARLQINSARSIPANKYSDDEYEIISVQFNQAQRSLTEARSLLSEKDYEISELTNKIEYLKRNEVESKNRFNEERNDFESELQNVLNRERALRTQLLNLQTEPQSYHSHDQNSEHGLHMYQQECDRLTKITEELQEEVSALKLKLTYMTNQEDRIAENLTVMTLTFVEVEALRERIKNKENEISDVRKSLIQYASSEEINTVNSRLQLLSKIQNKEEFRSQTNTGSYEEQNTSAGPYISHHPRINNAPEYESINSSFRQSGYDHEGYNYEYNSGIGYERPKERQEEKEIQADRRLKELASSITDHEDFQRNNHLNLGSHHQVNTSQQGITYAMRENKVIPHQPQNPTLQEYFNAQVQPSQQQNSLGGSWRYGAQTSKTNINSQVQVNPASQAKILNSSFNNSSQHQIKINFGSNNSIGSNKIISPQPEPQLHQQHHQGFVQGGFGIQGGYPVGQIQGGQVANYPGFNR